MLRLSILLLATLAGLAHGAEQRIYLLATANLGGSNFAQSIFLHEPDITRLEDCEAARLQGIRERDWARYHHIFMRDRMQGFTVQMHYRCVRSEQLIDSWYDKDRYDHAYLIEVDGEARMRLSKAASLAACTAQLENLPEARRQQAQCAKSNQRLLNDQ
ncbi:MAG TPA: hypothetical protein VFY62_01510 [Pseudomonas sp.]|nr:hypothetical protein [Pseudomonas sp.]